MNRERQKRPVQDGPTKRSEEEGMLDLYQAAVSLGIHHSRLRKWITDGVLTPTVMGRAGRGGKFLLSPALVEKVRKRLEEIRNTMRPIR